MYTYAQLLRFLEAYKALSSYTADDGSKRTNYFGADTYKIARIIKLLSKVEEEFIEFRNNIIKEHNPENMPSVEDHVVAAIEREYQILLNTPYTGIDSLPSIDYNCLVGGGNKVGAEPVAILMDFIENLPD